MKRHNLLPILALSMAMVGGTATAQSYREGRGDWGFDSMMSGWGGMMILGPIMMILILVLAIVIAVTVLRWLGVLEPAGRKADDKESAIEILEHRFARGEIDEAEFKDRKKELGQ